MFFRLILVLFDKEKSFKSFKIFIEHLIDLS